MNVSPSLDIKKQDFIDLESSKSSKQLICNTNIYQCSFANSTRKLVKLKSLYVNYLWQNFNDHCNERSCDSTYSRAYLNSLRLPRLFYKNRATTSKLSPFVCLSVVYVPMHLINEMSGDLHSPLLIINTFIVTSDEENFDHPTEKQLIA